MTVLIHHYGEDTGAYVLGRGGLLFQAEIEGKTGEKITVTSDESWRIRRCEAWDPTTP